MGKYWGSTLNDPDRYQMKDLKRRLTSLEKTVIRLEARVKLNSIFRKVVMPLQDASKDEEDQGHAPSPQEGS